MDNKNLIILALVAIVLVLCGVIAAISLTSNTPANNTTNESVNVTVNETNNTNDTNNTTTTQTTKKSSSKSSSKSSNNDGYHWSEQYGDYVKEYTDSNGNQHIDTKSGNKESYNPNTGILTTKTRDGKVYYDEMSH